MPTETETTKPKLFEKGGPGGPGRPPGVTNFQHMIRRKAEEYGVDLDELAFEILQSMARLAIEGDKHAAALFFDRLYGPLPKEGVKLEVNNNVQNVTRADVPRLPSGSGLNEWATKFLELAERQGVVEKVQARKIEVVDRGEAMLE